MPFESIIITGTSCSGKSSLAIELCNIYAKDNSPFKQVKAVTTRARRTDDFNYEYIDEKDYDSLLNDGKLLVHDTYRGKKYGIKKEEYDKILKGNMVPVLIITPCSASKLLFDGKYLCFFIDAKDDVLIKRWNERSKNNPSTETQEDFIEQTKVDRQYQDGAHYILDNINISESASLISLLWKCKNQGGALSQKFITNMVKCGMLLRDAELEMINGASYDLRLGDEYYYDGKIQRLSDKHPFLTIEPYDYAIVSCKETAWIPRDIIAKFGLSVGLFCQGIILSNGPQIDPGFRGTLFCLLFNTSNRAVHLKRGKHYATIEFNKMIGYAEPYEGKYQGKEHIIEYIPENALHGAINELKKDVEQLKAESRIMQNIYLGVVALMFAIVSILLVIK